MSLEMFLISFIALVFLLNEVQCKGDCYCGYGGVCRFAPITVTPVRTDCSKCGITSKGLYRDCHNLLDHCESYPCLNGGTCVMTFGGFFCRCQPQHYGHMCQNERKKSETLAVVNGPRIWYQVNRIWGGLTRENQLIHFAVEDPGDAMSVQVRFADGRISEFSEADLKVIDAKQKCLEEVRKWPKASDPKVCETLPDTDLHSTTIDIAYFDDKFATYPFETVPIEVNGKNVSAGRLDDIHITIMNWKMITYSGFYRVITGFEIWPKCLYKINFFGCSVSHETPTVHEGERPIFLDTIRIPLSKCDRIARVKEMQWYITEQGNKVTTYFYEFSVKTAFLSATDDEDVYVDGSELAPGKHYINFVMVVEGLPPYHGHPATSYNYGRCWIKIVRGDLKVGIEGGNSRAVPCINPLSFRIFSYNKNYVASNFASIWRCNIEGLELCEKQRFLGPKIFFRPPPCGVTIEFQAMVVDVPTGSKTFFTTTVKTSIHIDTINCKCSYNCYPTINPLSSVSLGVEQIQYSTNSNQKYGNIKWEATLGGQVWGIERFIIPESQSARIEIPPYTFVNLTGNQIADQQLHIKASTKEVVAFILGDDRLFSLAKLQVPTYITCTNYMGLVSTGKFLTPIAGPPAAEDKATIKNTIRLIRQIALTGNHNDALTEMMYVSRSIASSNEQMYSSKKRIMEIMTCVTDRMDGNASNLVVSSKLNIILNTINRLMLISNLTEPPFNVSIDPWKAPAMPVKDRTGRNWLATYTMASETLHSVTSYYYMHVVKRITTPNDANILRLMFHALLRIQLARSWKDYILQLMQHNPILLTQMLLQGMELISSTHKSIELLMKSIDFHIDGYTGHLNISVGTTTAYGSVFLAYDAGEMSGRVFNDLNNIQVSVSVEDSTLKETDSLYLGVFVEVPLYDDFTARVHVFLLTHLTQRSVKGTIDVRMSVSNYREVCDPDQCLTTTISRSSNERSVAVFKLELGSEQDVLGIDADREVKIYLMSNTSLKSVLRNNVPQYQEVARAPSTNDTEFAEVIGYNDAFLGVLPSNNIVPDVPINLVIDTMQFVCVQKIFDDPIDINSKGSRSICEMVPTITRDNKTITCRCHRSGLVETIGVALKLTKVLQDTSNLDRQLVIRGRYEVENRIFNYLILIYPAIAFLLVFFAFWRDKSCRKKDQIQKLADTFPGDEFAYIICVCTSKRVMAGTRANVALQIFGSFSASRVHILRSKSHKVLGRGHEDWFVIFTPERLGKLNHLTLWHDYSKPCPAWYCSQVTVYDVEYQVWFRFIVDKWMSISAHAERSRITVVRSEKYNPEKEVGESFSFRQHYWREIKNTHSLLSPFTKHRREVHTFVMRACLSATVILALVCMVLLLDSSARDMGLAVSIDNIIIISIIASLVASIPFTISSFLYKRSVSKMKRTKTLDLNWVEQMKRQWANELPESENWTQRQTIAFTLHQYPVVSEMIEKQIITKSEIERTEKRSPPRRVVSKKGSQFSSPSRSLTMYKWMASSIYRPVTVQKYEYRLKWGYFVCAWAIVSSTIAVTAVFIGFWAVLIGWFAGRNGILIATAAIAIEFIRSSLVVLFLSYHSIYSQKRCNSEIFCLDLSGLENDAKIRNHLKFLQDTTKPYYHPLKTDEVQALYKNKQKRDAYVKIFCFLTIAIGMTVLATCTPWFKDTQNIYRIIKSTKEAYKEPMQNKFTNRLNLLKDVHTVEDISSYVFATLLPVSSVGKWYNNQPLHADSPSNTWKTFLWFVDRSSWRHGASTVRFLQADSARIYTATCLRNLNFTDVFDDAHGHFDKYAKHKMTYNRWHVLVNKTESQVIQDTYLLRGVYGVTDMFYPSSIGEEITPSRGTREHPAEMSLLISRFITHQTRAVIVQINIAHPSISQKAHNPQVGFTVLHILLENCATGLYTGSIKTEFFRANYSSNYMALALIYSFFTMVCFIPLVIGLSVDGLRAGIKRLLNLVLFFGTISSFVAAASNFYIHFYIRINDLENVKFDNHHIDFFSIMWLIHLSETSSGCFLLLTTVAGVIWLAQLTGIASGKIESNAWHLLTVYAVHLFISFCIGVLLNYGSFKNALKFERIAVYQHSTVLTDLVEFSYVVIRHTFLWPLQIGVVILMTSTYLTKIQTDGFVTKVSQADFNKYSKKKRFRRDAGQSKTDLTPATDSSSILLVPESTSEDRIESVASNTTARLDKKFSFWK